MIKKFYCRSYTVCGTPEYMAPELAERKGHNLTVDWWSLGVLIYELMTGYPPFQGRYTEDVQEKIRERDGKVGFPRRTFSTNAKYENFLKCRESEAGLCKS